VSCAHAEVGWKSECGEAVEQPVDPRSLLVDRSLWLSGACTVMKYIVCIIYISIFPFSIFYLVFHHSPFCRVRSSTSKSPYREELA
jgi:hypothetical protein